MTNYPFQDWIADLRLWEQSTDLQQRQHGPAVVLALTGLPREIAREVPAEQLANGAWIDINDGHGYIWHSGLDLLIHGISKKCAPLQVETAIGSMADSVVVR